MKYFNAELLREFDAAPFRAARPYPWSGFEGLLSEEGFRSLVESLPSTADMNASFGKQRKHGQVSHDRYVLEWEDAADPPAAWREFVAELDGPLYRDFLARMLGTSAFDLRYHWHYAPRDCSVSPHCDNPAKLGSHIFYFNPTEDWDPAWGGETLVLDDGGRFDRASAPDFDDFDREVAAQAHGNRSFLFARKKNSWHGVRPMQCPEGRMRRVFIVVIDRVGAVERVRRLVGLGSRGA